MALENIQYDEIMREYDRRRHRSRRLQKERREQAYRLVPRLKEIQNTIASLSAGRIHALLGKGSNCRQLAGMTMLFTKRNWKPWPKNAPHCLPPAAFLPIIWKCLSSARCAGIPVIQITEDVCVSKNLPLTYSAGSTAWRLSWKKKTLNSFLFPAILIK